MRNELILERIDAMPARERERLEQIAYYFDPRRPWRCGIPGLQDAILEHLARATASGWEASSFLLTSIREEGFAFRNVRSIYDFGELCELLGFTVRKRKTGPRGIVNEIGL